MNIFEQTGQWFSCKCREWRIVSTDMVDVTEQLPNTFKVHDCPEVTVYQKKKSVNRFFNRKIAN